MEPESPRRRLSGVSPDSIALPGDSWAPGVFDLESRLDVTLSRAEVSAEFHAFYAATRDHVGRALAMTLGDIDLATDAVDEAMVRAYQRWMQVRTYHNPSGWVYKVALNHARSRLRRLARRRAHSGGGPTTIAQPELEPAIVSALAKLSVEHRSVVVCRLVLDWSEADTAAALGIRPGTVKSRLARALAQLEPRLAHLRPEDRQ